MTASCVNCLSLSFLINASPFGELRWRDNKCRRHNDFRHRDILKPARAIISNKILNSILKSITYLHSSISVILSICRNVFSMSSLAAYSIALYVLLMARNSAIVHIFFSIVHAVRSFLAVASSLIYRLVTNNMYQVYIIE